MKRLLILFYAVVCMALPGCTGRTQPPEPAKCRVVTEIVIQVENTALTGQSRYTDPRKLTKVLNYLRRLDPWDLPATDTEASPGARYRITLRHSDGSAKHYDQIGYNYLRESDGRWREILPEHAVRLALLLVAVPPDAI